MQLQCDRSSLLSAITTAAHAVASRGSGTDPATMLLSLGSGKLSVTASDQDLAITAVVDVGGGSDGSVLVPGKLLSDIVKALPDGEVLLAGDGDDVRIELGKSKFAVRCYKEPEPRPAELPGGQGVHIPAAGLASALKQVIGAASSDGTRPVLTGVLIEAKEDGTRFVATDSYRLAVRDLAGASGMLPVGSSAIVPARAMRELERLASGSGEVSLLIEDRAVTFAAGQVTVSSRLIEGSFPAYSQLLPKSFTGKLTVVRAELRDAVRRVRLVARDSTTPVRLGLADGSLSVGVATSDWGTASEEIDASYDGAETAVAFNPVYLLDGLEAAGGADDVVLSVNGAVKPATLTVPGGDEFCYLIMPVRTA